MTRRDFKPCGRPVRPVEKEHARDGGDVNEAEVGLGGDDEQEIEAEEGVKAKVLPQPGQPSAKEIAEHEVSRIPFRSWCIHCVRGRARSDNSTGSPRAGA